MFDDDVAIPDAVIELIIPIRRFAVQVPGVAAVVVSDARAQLHTAGVSRMPCDYQAARG